MQHSDSPPPYEAAFIGHAPAPFRQWRDLVFQWVRASREKYGGSAMIVLPQKGHLLRDLRPLIPASIPIESHKTILNSSRAEVVVACNVAPDTLWRIDNWTGTLRALLVLPWSSMREIEPWLVARQAVDILGRVATPSVDTLTLGDPVIDAGVLSLTRSVNLATGLSHPLDRPKAVWTFRHLRRAGYTWNSHELEVWAAAHGWRLEDAAELAELAEKVRLGHRVNAGKDPYRQEIVEIWKSQISSK